MRDTVFSLTQTSTCPWNGTVSYYDVTVDEQVNKDAAWYYRQPGQAAAQIADHVAFWHGVQVRQVSDSGQASDGTEYGGGATGRGGIGGRPRAMLDR